MIISENFSFKHRVLTIDEYLNSFYANEDHHVSKLELEWETVESPTTPGKLLEVTSYGGKEYWRPIYTQTF